MKRDIIFKAKSLESGRWVEGDLKRQFDRTFISEMIGGITASDPGGGYDYQDIEVDPATVCQFTNQLEIFEGDYVDVQVGDGYSNDSFSTNGDCTLSGTVIFNSGMWMIIMLDSAWIPFWDILQNDMDVTVIGNIHDSEATK